MDMEEPNKTGGEVERNPDGTIKSGALNPNGRPKGKTMKEFAREYFMLKTQEEKIAYVENLEKVKPGFAWSMAEGNPATATDITSGGEKILVMPGELINKNEVN